jgi:excisionase family DNA binding protein
MLEDKPDILTVEEVAAILRVTERCVYAYVKNGAIKAFRFKTADGTPMRRLFIPKKSLLEYIEEAA